MTQRQRPNVTVSRTLTAMAANALRLIEFTDESPSQFHLCSSPVARVDDAGCLRRALTTFLRS